MYTLAKELGIRTLLLKEAPFLLISLIIAEIFYKWHSFTREMIGFLVTWTVLSFVGNSIITLLARPRASTT